MNLGQIRQASRGKYGLEFSTTEDQLFPNSFLNQLINEAHSWIAQVARPYFNPAVTLSNQTAAVAGSLCSVSLGATVIMADERTFLYKPTASAFSAWARLPLRHYASLLEEYGPLQKVAPGTPVGYFLHAGAADGEGRKATLVPGPSANFDLAFGAYVYPPEMTADTDQPELQASEHHRIIPAVCWKMAEFERSRGRPDAPVEMWAARALDEAEELARIIRDGTRSFQRTPQVGSSPLEDALGRMRANIAGRG